MTRCLESWGATCALALLLSITGCDGGGEEDAGAPEVDAGTDAGAPPGSAYVESWEQGDPGLTGIEQLAFAPDGTLFLTDAAAGRLAVVDLGPADAAEQTSNHFDDLPGFGRDVGAALGGTDMLGIRDIDVHPITHRVYAVARNATQTALLSVDGTGAVFAVDLSDVRYRTVAFTPDMAGSYAADLDVSSTHLIASIGSRTFTSGRVISVPFPLGDASDSTAATTRTYHRSHIQWEESDTIAPVDLTMVVEDAAAPYVAASYQCAPVVRLGLEDLTAGGQVLGETPFDVGPGRQITDMFAYAREGVGYVLLSYAAFDGSRLLVRAERGLLDSTEFLDEDAPIVVNRDNLSADMRVEVYPERTGVIAITPRHDDRFVALYGDGRLATHDLP